MSSSVKSDVRLANIPEEQTKVPIKLEMNNDTKCDCGRPLPQNNTNEINSAARCKFCTLFLKNDQEKKKEAKDETVPPKNNEKQKPLSLHLIRALDKERDAWLNLSQGVKREKLNRIHKLHWQ